MELKTGFSAVRFLRRTGVSASEIVQEVARFFGGLTGHNVLECCEGFLRGVSVLLFSSSG